MTATTWRFLPTNVWCCKVCHLAVTESGLPDDLDLACPNCAEIARLTRERNEARGALFEAEAIGVAKDLLNNELKSSIDGCAQRVLKLAGERDEAIAVAVWAAKNRIAFTDSMVGGPHLMIAGARVKVAGTDADIYRALKEARNGE